MLFHFLLVEFSLQTFPLLRLNLEIYNPQPITGITSQLWPRWELSLLSWSLNHLWSLGSTWRQREGHSFSLFFRYIFTLSAQTSWSKQSGRIQIWYRFLSSKRCRGQINGCPSMNLLTCKRILKTSTWQTVGKKFFRKSRFRWKDNNTINHARMWNKLRYFSHIKEYLIVNS